MYKLCIIVMFVDYIKLHYLISGLVIVSLVIIMLCDYSFKLLCTSCLLIIIISVYYLTYVRWCIIFIYGHACSN